ncbi:TPA: hypothetical protein HA244_03065 [Candidatus Micrarchaeota archaeon]|nr:hypothetical protein [Candidatus Micrarchaeota archaeon]
MVVHIDKLGRMVLPAAIRKMFKTSSFFLVAEGKEIKLKPVPSWEEMRGSIKGLDSKAFLKERHEEW